MTTHDEQTNTASTSTAEARPPTEPELSSTETEPSTAGTEPSAATATDTPRSQGEPQTMDTESSAARTELSDMENGPSTAQTEAPTAESEPPADEPLFADGTLSGLRSRWDDVQAAFVDDPKECVQQADALVAQVVEQLTAGFSEARSRLEEQWARGEKASTEDLRLALKRYREFFQRLLSV
jgi:hypothetical protein